jgi:Helix-turn-helix domain
VPRVSAVSAEGLGEPNELALLLSALVERRGVTYSKLVRLVELLPERDGRAPKLSKSTVSLMLTGKRVPSKDKLLSVLAACEATGDDLTRCMAAWRRAGGDED